jgi:glycosyltransferase involved in cell wall biosynthesis
MAMQLHKALLAEGAHSTLFHVRQSPRRGGTYEQIETRAEHEGVKIHMAQGRRDFRRMALAIEPKWDLMHVHTGDKLPSLDDVLGFRIALPGVPIVLTAHGTEDIRRGVDLRWTFPYAERLLARFLVPSEHKRQVVAKISRIGDRLMAVPNLVVTPPPMDRIQARNELGLPLDLPVITFVALIRRSKRAHEVIALIPKLRAMGLDPIVVIAGDGPDFPSLKSLAEPYGDRVRLLGYRTETRPIFSAANVFVHPSEIESFGLSMIEAGRYGNPVICSDIPITKNEFAGLPGYHHFPLGDVDAMAEATYAALQSHTVEEGERMKVEIERRFGARAVTQRHLAIYEDVIRRR